MDSLAKIQLVSNQRDFCTGLIYIGTQAQFLELGNARISTGTILLFCDAETPMLANLDKYKNATVLEASCSVAYMFNTINGILAGSIYTALPDARIGLMQVWDQIITSRLLANQDIIDALVNTGVKIQQFFRVLIVAFPDCNTENAAYIALGDKLNKIMPYAEVFRDSKSLVVLFFQKERTLDPPLPYDELNETLREYKAYMMIGHATRDYSMVRTQYLICRRSLEIGIHLSEDLDNCILYIKDYAMYYAIDMCAQRCFQVFGHMDIIYLIHPSIVAIRRYDITHKSDLLEVLNNYIINSGSLSKTSEEMFMHRNTVNNKIHKLKSMLPFDLEDGGVRQLLLFSCQTLRFYEKILNFEIKKK